MQDSSLFSDNSLVSLGQFGERARPLQGQLREAALVIGLGQTGLYAVARIHAMLNALLARREWQNNVRLLALARRRSLREETLLPREERLMLDMDAIAWTDVPGRYSQVGVAQWWPHSPRSPEVLADPTQVRAYNRLTLYDNAALVGETLFKLVRWLNDVGRGRDFDPERRIYVLASLAEAEGSGMIFDVVTRLRALCGDQPATMVGLFAMRATASASDPEHILAMANVYAALREIDAFTLQPEMFPSMLPVIGHTLPRTTSRRALDMILLSDDALSSSGEAPENTLAEGVVTWISTSLVAPEVVPALPQPVPPDAKADRFAGYSIIGASKIALPTRAAMDLAAVGLAQTVLKALKNTYAATSTAGWAGEFVARARTDLAEFDVLHTPDVINSLREWTYDFSAAGLLRRHEMRTARGETIRVLDLVMAEWRRLEKEGIAVQSLDQSAIGTVPDTLRSRIDTALGANLRELYGVLLGSPAELAYGEGYGLIWLLSAFEDLDRQIRAELPVLERALPEADAAVIVARDALFQAAEQHEARSGVRFSGSRKASVGELDTRAGAALTAMAELIALQARLDTWRALRERVDELTGQIRDVIPLVEQTSQSLLEFETTCRGAMEQAVRRPPEFPSAVVLTQDWFVAGVQNVAGLAQLQPRELLSQVYTAWGGGNVPSERRLSRFLPDILDASRRALAGAFTFKDLYDFLADYPGNAMLKATLSKLAVAAAPAMVATVDERHPAPTAYELVREVPRAFSAVPPASHDITRGFVPSPDPDEITVLRVVHGVMAEALPPIREAYRRAYDRAGAEGLPLHIDRRWDATIADLVQTTARREISMIWEDLLQAIHQGPEAANRPLDALVRALGVALDVVETVPAPRVPPDFRLVVYKLRPFRLKLPPPNCAVLFLYSHRSADEIGEEILRAVAPLPLEEQFVFIVNIAGRPDIDAIIEPLRRVDFTVLVLTEADIKHLIGARLPTRALSDLVLDHVNLTTVSPFFTRGPVPEHMFFGREREINEVRSKLRSHSVALIGGRRIGKTSTLQRIQRLLQPTDGDYAPYYLDCHGATNYHSFFWLINRRWNVNIDQDVTPVQFEDVITTLQGRHKNKNIAILFDEVDSLLLFDRQAENQETLFRTFRSLSNEKRCQYVLSGEKWLMRSIGDPYSALFNFAQAVRLEPLPPKVVHHLIAEPFEMLNVWIEQSEQLINRIYQISAGHPNIVQMICQSMVEELDKTPQNASLLTMAHLDQATSRRTLQEEIVQTIWGQMNPLARLVTLVWPEGERFLTLADVEKLLRDAGIGPIPPERLDRTAKDLELYCFVRPRDNDRLELIPMAFPAILDFMTDKRRQIEIMRRHYEADPQGAR